MKAYVGQMVIYFPDEGRPDRENGHPAVVTEAYQNGRVNVTVFFNGGMVGHSRLVPYEKNSIKEHWEECDGK